MSILYLHLHGYILSTCALTFMSTHALGFTDTVNTAIPKYPVINAELFKIVRIQFHHYLASILATFV